MADTFFNPISIPDVPEGTNIPAPESGYLKLYAENGKLKQINSAGVEVNITNDEASMVVTKTQLQVDAGNASTTFQQYQLRLDFGSGGANINPTGTV